MGNNGIINLFGDNIQFSGGCMWFSFLFFNSKLLFYENALIIELYHAFYVPFSANFVQATPIFEKNAQISHADKWMNIKDTSLKLLVWCWKWKPLNLKNYWMNMDMEWPLGLGLGKCFVYFKAAVPRYSWSFWKKCKQIAAKYCETTFMKNFTSNKIV